MTKSSKIFRKRKYYGNQFSKRLRVSEPELVVEPTTSNSCSRPSTSGLVLNSSSISETISDLDSGKCRPTEATSLCDLNISRPRPSEYNTLNSEPRSNTSRPICTESTTKHSASFQKLNDRPNEAVFENKPCTYVIVDLEVLSEKLKDFAVCKECGIGSVVISEEPDKRMGCAAKLRLYCEQCDAKSCFLSSSKTEKGQFDLNLRFVYALRSVGCGQEDGKMLCTILDVPGPPTRFMKYNRTIDPVIKKAANDCMIEAVQDIVQKTESTDLAVAVDGSWQKRGFSSLNGVVTVTSMETGMVLDVHIMSKYCQGCNLVKGDKNKLNKHREDCELNYEGNSGGMEIEGARAIFCRSLINRGVRYLTYLGDGDSKGHAAVCEAKPYGEDVIIEKAECIGHVKKRMGARLRNLCKKQKKGEKLADGKNLGGKGRLTLVQINNLQEYYGQAIKNNCHDVAAMKNAIWSIYYHKLSTDERPHHHLCPSGENSWCPYNRAKVTKEKYTHKHSLPPAILHKIEPIFKDLSNEVLLSRCSLGRTQNPNESFNGLIWKRLPKTVFSGIVTMRVGVYDAVLAYNKGALGKINVLRGLGLKCSESVSVRLQRCDFKRVKEAEKKNEEEKKKKRKFQRIAKLKKDEAEKFKDYEPGMF